MPAHIDISMFYPESVEPERNPLRTPHDMCIDQYNRLHDGAPVKFLEIFQSTFDRRGSLGGLNIRNKQNGFVHTVTQAYNDHHHLVIRPDDVWIAILSQFSCYINKHAEEFRDQFVTHLGKKKLVVVMSGDRDTEHFGSLCHAMSGLVQKNILDKGLRDWMIPSFTTTTENDISVCSVVMMATMKAYFEYEMSKCGIPEVTLEGERSDWVDIRNRIERLEKYGDEPTKWLRFLRPVLDRFIKLFDGEDDIDFWNKVSVNYSLASGRSYLSGWITAFCVWDNDGNWQGEPQTEPYKIFGQLKYHELREIDGVIYPTIESDKVPMGFSQVDVLVKDDYADTECNMFAGHMCTLVEGEREDTVRPYPTWFMFADPTKKHVIHAPGGRTILKKRITNLIPEVQRLQSRPEGPSSNTQVMDSQLLRKLRALGASCKIQRYNFTPPVATNDPDGQQIITLPFKLIGDSEAEETPQISTLRRMLQENSHTKTSDSDQYYTLEITTTRPSLEGV